MTAIRPTHGPSSAAWTRDAARRLSSLALAGALFLGAPATLAAAAFAPGPAVVAQSEGNSGGLVVRWSAL